MKMPVHYVHHKYGMWHQQLVSRRWWDHVFWLTKPVEWLTEEGQQPQGYGNFGGGKAS